MVPGRGPRQLTKAEKFVRLVKLMSILALNDKRYLYEEDVLLNRAAELLFGY
jgi:hypothetical protein